MSQTKPIGEWYPSEITPHLYYISGDLCGMATALFRQRGTVQRWEAFDMRKRHSEGGGGVFLGEYKSLEAAKLQIEHMVTSR